MNAKEYIVLKSYKGLELVKFDQPKKKKKNGLSLDAAIEIFNNCIK